MSARRWQAAGQVVQFFGAAILFRDHVGEFAFCTGESMMPTLAPSGDIVIVEKLSLLTATSKKTNIKRNDVIVCTSPQDASKVICKRVVGLPGDLVWGGVMAERVPAGCLWLEGDNKGRSNDSRAFGAVPTGLVRGRVIMKVWPLRQFGTLL